MEVWRGGVEVTGGPGAELGTLASPSYMGPLGEG